MNSTIIAPTTTGGISLTKLLLVCGILSSVLYVAMCIYVPLEFPGYNSATQTISELSAINAPTRTLWVVPGIVYTLLMTAFGWGVFRSTRTNRRVRLVGILLMIYGVIGLGWPLAPMHLRHELAAGGGTGSDTMHIVFSMISVILMMLAIGFCASAFGKRFRIYSISTLVLLIVPGIITAIAAPKLEANLPTPLLGIWERFMIGVFLVWVVVLALTRLRALMNSESN